ncbi:hypothetical protein WSM22_03000 [Cytophagales bacterium WSM2-2]|nr:hypothetical protein WSM22_03000 [Cytophagales bacterium WSM2-2]
MKNYFEYGQQPLTRAQLSLMNKLAQDGKAQTLQDLLDKKLKFETYASTFRFVIPNAQAGKRTLFDVSKSYLEGAIPEEWDRGMLQDGVNISVSHIRTGFVADAVITVAQAGVAYASQPNSWPAALRNGRYMFQQSNGNPNFVQVQNTGTQAASFNPLGVGDAFELEEPIVFVEGKSAKFELWIPDSQAFASPAGANLLEINFYGSWIRPKGA